MNEDAVEHFVRALWGSRDLLGGRIDSAGVTTWGRMMAEAVHAQVRASDCYSPEMDRRVWWARQVLASAVRGDAMSRASAELEATVEHLLGVVRALCGKDLASGMNEKS